MVFVQPRQEDLLACLEEAIGEHRAAAIAERWKICLTPPTDFAAQSKGAALSDQSLAGSELELRGRLPTSEGPLLLESVIEAGIVQAFRESEYRVHGDEPFTLRVGENCPALSTEYKRHRVDCSVYITACNPFSQMLDDEANAERHADLGRAIGQGGLVGFEGVDQHPTNQWSGEASFLIFGLTLEAAKALGTRLEQDAIVWMGADAVPQLVLLR